MAIVEVTGIVKKVFASSFTIAEKIQVPGYDFEKTFTIWTKEAPTIGSTVTIRGRLSMKIKSYGDGEQKKYYVDVSVNDPTVTLIE